MTQTKKHILVSLSIIFATVIVYTSVELLYGGGAGLCCGAPAKPSLAHLDDYLAGIMVIGIVAVVFANLIISVRNKHGKL